MAQYDDAERSKNRRTIILGVVGLHLLLAGISVFNSSGVEEVLGGSVAIFALAALLWFLFAGKKSGSIDGEWVDGWNNSWKSEKPMRMFDKGPRVSNGKVDEDSHPSA